MCQQLHHQRKWPSATTPLRVAHTSPPAPPIKRRPVTSTPTTPEGNLRLVMKPRLPRQVTPSAKVNLNKYWDQLESFYLRKRTTALMQRLDNAIKKEDSNPNLIRELNGNAPTDINNNALPSSSPSSSSAA